MFRMFGNEIEDYLEQLWFLQRSFESIRFKCVGGLI